MKFYYIGTGELTKMYTLRFFEDRLGLETDQYVRNLSTDWDTAVKNAKSHITDDTPLKSSKSFSLEEIRRRDAEEIAKYKAIVEKEVNDRQDEYERSFRSEFCDLMNKDMFPFGKHKGEKFSVADPSYIRYVATKLCADVEEFKKPIFEALAKKLIKLFPNVCAEYPVPNGEFVDDTGKRREFTGTVISRFGFDTYYGWMFIVKIVLDSGELVVYKGAAVPHDADDEPVDESDNVTFMAKIKGTDTYEGENQTIIQRITKLTINEK